MLIPRPAPPSTKPQKLLCSILLTFTARKRLHELVRAVAASPDLAARLGLTSEEPNQLPPSNFTPGPRALTKVEIQHLAEVLQAPHIRTQRQVFAAMGDSTRDTNLTSAAVRALGEIYKTPPAPPRPPGRPVSISLSRVIEALIMKAGAIIEAEESTAQARPSAAAGNDSQAGNKSSNSKTRKTASAARVHRSSVKTRAA